MPELPEVEIVCRNLSEIIKPPQPLKNWHFFRSDLRFTIPKKSLLKLIGLNLVKIERRAKYILLNFEELTVVSHLGMTGSWREESEGWVKRKHDHLAFEIHQKKFLVYEDPRRFGFIEVLKTSKLKERFKDLGEEPLGEDTNFEELTLRFKKLESPIKTALMNQKLLVGVGNIYASEVLFRTQINPLKKCSKVSPSDYQKLWSEVKIILSEAIANGGSTIENYRNSYGQKGQFQNNFFVYGRPDEECFKCNTLIKSTVQSGRTTFWCPSCQKK
jgi:formamidopyrimidine-DNA glycosylase